jgi:DNA-binding NtrC family response regulator
MRILVVDDEARYAEILRLHLDQDGFEDVATAGGASEALDLIRSAPVDLLVTDLRMPGMSGLELMAEVARLAPGTDVVLMTAFADVQTARKALKRGAVDYLVKPFDNAELSAIANQVKARREVDGRLESSNEDRIFAGMVGNSEPMRRLFAAVERAAGTETTVLILGESGTGKELVARAVHDLSRRHGGPFVDLHCAAIPENLLESELFGHERGAFTGADRRKPGRLETADGGTVFLDEIGEMPAVLQPKLLRFLQDHRFHHVGGHQPIRVDVRVVAATNRDLEAAVRAGEFREDLWYRLDVMRIMLPRLAERREDIPALVRHFLRVSGAPRDACSSSALRALASYDWPGNVRQLANVIERSLIESRGKPIDLEHLPASILDGEAGRRGPADAGEVRELGLDANERHLIEQALRRAGGNKTRAAEFLGISRRRLYSRMKVLGIDGE